MRFQQQFRLFRTVTTGVFCRHPERIKRVDVATCGQHIGRANEIATGHRRHITALQGAQEARKLCLLLQERVDLGASLLVRAVDQLKIVCARIIAEGFSNDVQTIRNQRVFCFQ